jgi:hypothetical protein
MKIKSVKPCLNKVLYEIGMKQQTLSELTGIQQGTISRFDRTNRHDDYNLFVIANALNVKIEDLFIIEYE